MTGGEGNEWRADKVLDSCDVCATVEMVSG